MSAPHEENPYDAPLDDKLKEHSYDGIHEYDKKLPNWWLFTLYIAIFYSIIHWSFFLNSETAPSDGQQVVKGMNAIETKRLSGAIADIDNEKLWEMSQNPEFVSAGRDAFTGNCVSCHGANLQGGIGLNLADNEWKYGGNPMDVMEIIANGSPDASSGMIAWEPSLGPKRVAELTAFVMSYHEPNLE